MLKSPHSVSFCHSGLTRTGPKRPAAEMRGGEIFWDLWTNCTSLLEDKQQAENLLAEGKEHPFFSSKLFEAVLAFKWP